MAKKRIFSAVASGLIKMPRDFEAPIWFASLRALAEEVIARDVDLYDWRMQVKAVVNAIEKCGAIGEHKASRWRIVATFVVTSDFLSWEPRSHVRIGAWLCEHDANLKDFDGPAVGEILADLRNDENGPVLGAWAPPEPEAAEENGEDEFADDAGESSSDGELESVE
jgi:hypothetical protein